MVRRHLNRHLVYDNTWFCFWWWHVVLFCRLWVQCAPTVRGQSARHVFRKQVQETQAPISARENHPQTVVQQPRRKYVHAISHHLAPQNLKLLLNSLFGNIPHIRKKNCAFHWNLHNLFGFDWDLAKVWTGRLIRLLYLNFFLSTFLAQKDLCFICI